MSHDAGGAHRRGRSYLGALLGSATRGGLGRLGQMHPRTDRRELLDHEPPTRRRVQRHLELQIAEALGEPPHAGAMRGSYALARDSPAAAELFKLTHTFQLAVAVAELAPDCQYARELLARRVVAALRLLDDGQLVQ